MHTVVVINAFGDKNWLLTDALLLLHPFCEEFPKCSI